MNLKSKKVKSIIAIIMSLATVFTVAICVVQNAKATEACVKTTTTKKSYITYCPTTTKCTTIKCGVTVKPTTTKYTTTKYTCPTTTKCTTTKWVWTWPTTTKKTTTKYTCPTTTKKTTTKYTCPTTTKYTTTKYTCPTTTKKTTTQYTCPTTTKKTTTLCTTTTRCTTSSTATVNGVVVTGNWTSYGNYIASITGSYSGNFGSSVTEVGIEYSKNPSMASSITAIGSGSSFSVWATDLSNGTWYYRAYVKTAAGTFYGDIKTATYP